MVVGFWVGQSVVLGCEAVRVVVGHEVADGYWRLGYGDVVHESVVWVWVLGVWDVGDHCDGRVLPVIADLEFLPGGFEVWSVLVHFGFEFF